MSMIKKGSAVAIDRVWVPSKGVKTASATKAAEELQIISDMPEDITFSDDYVYSTVRAISARVNMNMDGFTKEELLGIRSPWTPVPTNNAELQPHNDKFGYRTFIGKNNHVDHFNQPEIDHGDPYLNAKHAPRGKILWAWYEEDPLDDEVKLGGFPDPITKLANKDVWIKLLIANKKSEFPVLCRAIEDGIVTKVSMGAEVSGSSCSVCGQFAGAPWQYCDHVRYGRGQPFAASPSSHFVQAGAIRERDPVLAFENNHDLQFFEESWILDIQADPTAVITDLIKGEPGTALRNITSSKTAGKRDYHQILLDLINAESEMNPDDLKKVALLVDKHAATPAVNLNVDNIEELIDKQRLENDQTFVEQNVTFDKNVGEFDHQRPPHEQPGEHYPKRPFPCSAMDSAGKANPEYPIDPTIDVDVCASCIYNNTDKIGAVDCTFDEVVRPGGYDPLEGKGFEPADTEESGPEHDKIDYSSGLINDDGIEINEFPGIKHPPGLDFRRRSGIYKLKALFNVGEGRWKLGDYAEENFRKQPEGYQYGDNEEQNQKDTFKHTIGISVPSTQQTGKPVDPEGRKWVIESIETVMSREFGGTDTREAKGSFVENDTEEGEETKHDDDKVIITSATDDLERGIKFIESLAMGIEDAFNQYAVEYWIDGKRHYTRDVHQ